MYTYVFNATECLFMRAWRKIRARQSNACTFGAA